MDKSGGEWNQNQNPTSPFSARCTVDCISHVGRALFFLRFPTWTKLPSGSNGGQGKYLLNHSSIQNWSGVLLFFLMRHDLEDFVVYLQDNLDSKSSRSSSKDLILSSVGVPEVGGWKRIVDLKSPIFLRRGPPEGSIKELVVKSPLPKLEDRGGFPESWLWREVGRARLERESKGIGTLRPRRPNLGDSETRVVVDGSLEEDCRTIPADEEVVIWII